MRHGSDEIAALELPYDYVPIVDRPPLSFPARASVAVIFTINMEYWEPSRPGQKTPMFQGGPMTIPHALPGDVFDVPNWTWREYGQRVGVWRVIDELDKAEVPASCTFNALTALRRRRMVDAAVERRWELVQHNWAQTDLLADYAHEPDRERAVIRKSLDVYEDVIGRPAKVWLSSALRSTLNTPAILKEFGLIAICDYLNDDQPYLVRTPGGPLVSVPYSNDVNDFALFSRGGASAFEGLEVLKLCFDQLRAEGQSSGRIMNVGLHPHVIGQPHRIYALRAFLAYLKGFDDIWYPSREELATWYLAEQGKQA